MLRKNIGVNADLALTSFSICHASVREQFVMSGEKLTNPATCSCFQRDERSSSSAFGASNGLQLAAQVTHRTLATQALPNTPHIFGQEARGRHCEKGGAPRPCRQLPPHRHGHRRGGTFTGSPSTRSSRLGSMGPRWKCGAKGSWALWNQRRKEMRFSTNLLWRFSMGAKSREMLCVAWSVT